MSKLLDIGVMIPTRNSMPGLIQHVADLNEWIEQVKQVVVVDSESSDGTLEYLKEHLQHSNVLFLQHPPGLYQSWNAGLTRVDTRYTYIATINDRMPFETLQRLYLEAERVGADVVLSPPEIVTESGERLAQDWPIHDYIKDFVQESTHLLSVVDRLLFSALYLPGTLIGSSASNLYRTDRLQESPFSAEFGHAGDSAWALSSADAVKWIIVSDVASQFVMHRRASKHRAQNRDCRARLCALASQRIEGLLNQLNVEDRKLLEPHVAELIQLWSEKETVMEQYRSLRSSRWPWYLRLNGWQVRRQKSSVRQRLSTVEAQILLLLPRIRSSSISR